MWDVIVIGGGAAGLWAAGTAAARNLRVLVLEKNVKAGVKILMSGGSRCNITHHCSIDGIMEAFGAQGRFLKAALHNLPPEEVVRTMNALGVATKVEDTGKVFPVSDRALDVRDALVRRLQTAGAELRTGIAVRDLQRLTAQQWRVVGDQEQWECRNVILCTGGLSYSGCGTTGDGYPWAQQLGHQIEPTHPALTPLLSPAVWVHELQGLTLPDVVTTAVVPGIKPGKDPRHRSRSSLLWTHFGLSGPGPMNVSGAVAAATEPHKTQLLIDLVPEWSEEQTARQLSPEGGRGKRSLAQALHEMVPRRMAELLLARAELASETQLAELPKRGRLQLLEGLKRLSVPLAGTRGYPKAEVTAGGVNRREVNPQTLESRLAPGLFLAGEILDVDGPIGGFNFQAAFATGHTAALHVCSPTSSP
jgi:predicted Rossmann fold flavoprotein